MTRWFMRRYFPTKIVNANREKLMQKLNDFAAGKGVDVHICDCAATFR